MEVQGTIENKNGQLLSATGKGVRIFGLKMVIIGMKMYLESNGRMMANRSYTPKNMMALASKYTGKTYKRSQLRQAYIDLIEYYNSPECFEGVEITNS